MLAEAGPPERFGPPYLPALPGARHTPPSDASAQVPLAESAFAFGTLRAPFAREDLAPRASSVKFGQLPFPRPPARRAEAASEGCFLPARKRANQSAYLFVRWKKKT